MNAAQAGVDPLDQKGILEDARRQAGLDDFGPDYFLEPMAKLLDSIRKDARLHEAGIALQRGRMVNGLVARLRMFDAIKKHPEIADEKVEVAAVIAGLPRTGSTMFHRMLSRASGFTAIRWWETQNYAPFPGEERGKPIARRQAGEKIMEGYVQAGLMSIHPFAIDEPDEEIIIMDQFYVGTMPESAMYVPSYAEWLSTYDTSKAYGDLITVLKFLQWQDVTRKGKRWVLKTPGHLSMVNQMLKAFPNAVLIMTHRDPVSTVPSYCSMCDSIVKMSTSEIDSVTFGRFTEKRWAGFLKQFTEARSKFAENRFIDVQYENLTAAPLGEARRVLERLGVAMTPEIEAAMQEWLVENAREKRAAHHYTLEQFGLDKDELEKDFAAYKARFLK